MEKLDQIKKALQGKKTYYVLLVGALYIIGCWAGFWQFDEKLAALFGFGGIAFIRAAFSRSVAPLLLAGSLMFGVTGCQTQNASGRLLASTVITVDAGMRGWMQWVKAGQATADQEKQVEAAYEKYQAAEALAEKAYVTASKLGDESIFTQAATTLTATKSELLALINSFTGAQPAK